MSHEMAEKGEPLTAESLNRAYAQLNAQYYSALKQDELIAYEWMRIPHFYRAFYVYKYATGYSAAMALATAIRTRKARPPWSATASSCRWAAACIPSSRCASPAWTWRSPSRSNPRGPSLTAWWISTWS